MNTHDKNVAKVEDKVLNSLFENNLPLVTADHLGPLFKDFDISILCSWKNLDICYPQ